VGLIADLIDEGKRQRKIATDAAYARVLKVTPQTLSQWRLGQAPVPLKRVVTMAKIAEENPGKAMLEYVSVYGEPEVQDAFRELVRLADVWERMPASEKARWLKGIAATFVLAIAGWIAPTRLEAHETTLARTQAFGATPYTLCALAALWALLRPFLTFPAGNARWRAHSATAFAGIPT
jgi:hypothetical protein